MASLLANTQDSILLHPSEVLTMVLPSGTTVNVLEFDGFGNIIGNTTYSLTPTSLGPFPTVKIYKILAIGGTVTYTVGLRDFSLQESRLLGASGVALPTINNTSEQFLATVTIPAGRLGPNGLVRVITFWTLTNNANVKTPRIRLGGQAGTILWSPAMASFATFKGHAVFINRGAQNSQVAGDAAFGGTAGAVATAAIDTAAAQDLVISAQKATGTDTMTLEAYMVELNPLFG